MKKDQKKLSHDRAPQSQSLAVHVSVCLLCEQFNVFEKKEGTVVERRATSTMLANSKVLKNV
jgi:hypothetical protein